MIFILVQSVPSFNEGLLDGWFLGDLEDNLMLSKNIHTEYWISYVYENILQNNKL